jgi:hypothetical protein
LQKEEKATKESENKKYTIIAIKKKESSIISDKKSES